MADDARVHIVAYDRRWPLLFEAEQALLASVLGPWLAGPIEHVGSTAVPGLRAKPVIDIMAGVHGLAASRPSVYALRGVGYLYAPYRTEVMHWFCKPHPSFRLYHLHLVPHGSALWCERLAFRDYLRAHAAVAREYGELKTQLAAIHGADREAYTEAKGPFVARVVERALGQPAT